MSRLHLSVNKHKLYVCLQSVLCSWLWEPTHQSHHFLSVHFLSQPFRVTLWWLSFTSQGEKQQPNKSESSLKIKEFVFFKAWKICLRRSSRQDDQSCCFWFDYKDVVLSLSHVLCYIHWALKVHRSRNMFIILLIIIILKFIFVHGNSTCKLYKSNNC